MAKVDQTKPILPTNKW